MGIAFSLGFLLCSIKYLKKKNVWGKMNTFDPREFANKRIFSFFQFGVFLVFLFLEYETVKVWTHV